MKKSLTLILLGFLLAFNASFKSENSAISGGIKFFKGSLNDAFTESEKTGKPVFIDFYASWCGPCSQLKKSFRDNEVGEYFNKNFICFSMDGESEEGKIMRRAYGVTSYPTLIITNADGKQLARTEGYMKPYILINFGRRVVP